MSIGKKILLVVGIVLAAFIVLVIVVGVTGGGKPAAQQSPSTSASSVARQTATVTKRSTTTARPSATSHPYKTSGDVPSPYNQYIGGKVCDVTQSDLVNGKLMVNGVEAVTSWSVEFDDSKGQLVGNDASGMVGTGDPDSIKATGPATAEFARVAMAGATTAQCTVIAAK